jgi:formylmethanofuran dehydrogenase subunit E
MEIDHSSLIVFAELKERYGKLQILPSSEPNKFSYLRGDKRVRLTVGRFLHRVLKLGEIASDQELEDLADELIKEFCVQDVTIKILKGEEITDAYRNCVGGGSCMTGGSAEQTRLYEYNPKRIRLATCYNGRGSARCVVWKTDKGVLVHDRVYSDQSRARTELKNGLKRMGVHDIERYVDHKQDVSGLRYEEGEIPYLDNFYNGDIINGRLRVSTYTGGYDLQNTEGYLEGNMMTCECCGDAVPEEDTWFPEDDSGPYCPGCFADNYVRCDRCDNFNHTNGTYSVKSGDIVCQGCVDEYYFECEDCGELVHQDEGHYVNDQSICTDCVDENYIPCEDCGEYIHKDEADSDDLCEDCHADKENEDSDIKSDKTATPELFTSTDNPGCTYTVIDEVAKIF